MFDPEMNFSCRSHSALRLTGPDCPPGRDLIKRYVEPPAERKSRKFVHVTEHHFFSKRGFVMSKRKIAVTLSLIAAMSLSAFAPANSAPLTALSAAAKPSDPAVQQVRWGGWHGGGWGGGWGWGFGALAAGALIGGALAAATTPYYDPYYYGYGYGYPAYGYAPGYAYSYPAYGYSRPYGAYAYHRPYVRHRHYRY